MNALDFSGELTTSPCDTTNNNFCTNDCVPAFIKDGCNQIPPILLTLFPKTKGTVSPAFAIFWFTSKSAFGFFTLSKLSSKTNESSAISDFFCAVAENLGKFFIKYYK